MRWRNRQSTSWCRIDLSCCKVTCWRKRSFIQKSIQNFDFACLQATVARRGQFLDEQADSSQELFLDILPHPAKKVPNRSAEQKFIRQQRLQIRRLFQPLMAANVGAGLGAQKERHFPLRQIGAFAVCANVIG